MSKNRKKCSHCWMDECKLWDVEICDNDFYYKVYLCKNCNKKTFVKAPLVLDGPGYTVIPFHGRSVLLHRKIWEIYNNKKLFPGEIVHHRNGITRDSRPLNLVVVRAKEHGEIRYTTYIEMQKEICDLKETIKKLKAQICS